MLVRVVPSEASVGIDIDDHGDARAGVDDAGGDGIKMLEMQGGVEGRVGGVFLRQGAGVAGEIEGAVAGKFGGELERERF